MTKLSRRVAACAAVGVLTMSVAGAGMTAFAQENAGRSLSPQGSAALDKFGACVSSSKKADVLLVLDESASLRGQNSVPTDPDNVRIRSAQDLVSQLSLMGQDMGAEVNVKLAGFGQGYRSGPEVYGDWVDVVKHPDALRKHIEAGAERNNDQYTMYGDAFSGMLTDLSQHSAPDACQVVLFFTDGQLTVPGSADADTQARQAICAADSPVAALRRSGVQVFSVGLIPTGEDSPEKLLKSISESQDCTGVPANGAYFNAGSNAAALYTAFRGLIPSPAAKDVTQHIDEVFDFYLDNSVAPARFSAQPQERVSEGSLVPIMTGPNGESVELQEGKNTVAGNTITVTTNPDLPGMFDAEMEPGKDSEWAGKWSFAYKRAEDVNTQYHAQFRVAPGMHLRVDEFDNSAPALGSDETLHVSLVRGDGSPVSLEGDANLRGQLEAADGTVIDLGAASIKNGTAELPLEAVDKALTGTINLAADITTAGADGQPGTELSPVTAQSAASVIPVNMPRVSPSVRTSFENQETTVSIPVEGPGSVWIADSTFNDSVALLPVGISEVAVTSSHNSEGNALTLGQGETGTIELTVTAGQLADGPVSLPVTAHLTSAENSASADMGLTIDGPMRAPISTSAFVAALIGALLLALLIPLGLLYLIKYLTGRIPTNLRLYARAIPVKTDRGQLYREDTGRPFHLDYEELVVPSNATEPTATSVKLAGHTVKVHYGANPLTVAKIVATSPFSVSDDGQQHDTNAQLPLALHNHWFVVANPDGSGSGTVVVNVDERANHAQVDTIASEIGSRGAELLERVTLQAADQGDDTPQQPEATVPSSPSGQVFPDTTPPANPSQGGFNPPENGSTNNPFAPPQ
ncbi:vWA domain-containing protein [Corynebacterium renale]|uniref:vWA domain-containing protein n=1 Tax=Corynebacterium renale TaxID=1724 RepID=UPI00155865D7|nr:vWA domain-containing protein [Corynebacterium renale]